MMIKRIISCFLVLGISLAALPLQAANQASSPDAMNKYESAFWQLCTQVKAQHPQGDRINCEQSFRVHAGDLNSAAGLRAALQRAFNASGVKQITVLSQAQTEEHDLKVNSASIGVGLSLREIKLVSTGFRVSEVKVGSTAQEAGLRQGDLIVELDGASFTNNSQYEAIKSLAGTPGSVARLTVIRDGVRTEVNVKRDIDERLGISVETLSRDAFTINAVISKSSAEAAGAQKEDIVLAIDGVSTAEMNYARAMTALDGGRENSVVMVSVLRNGQVIELEMNRQFIPDMSKTLDLRGQMGGNDDWYRLQIKHLDWIGLPDLLDDFMDSLNEHRDLIIDLRGASGNDPDLAAQLASRFIDSGAVLKFKGGNKVESSFSIDNGKLMRAEGNGISDSTSALGFDPAKRYKNRLLILVDGNTSGTAEAFAAAMQKAGRAQVMGLTTAAYGDVTSVVEATVDGDKIAVRTLVGQVSEVDGSPLKAVTPDIKSWHSGEVGEQALSHLRGDGFWYSQSRILTYVYIGAALFGLLTLAYLFATRNSVAQDEQDEQDVQDGQDEQEKKDESADESKEQKPATPFSAARLLLCIGLITLVPLALLWGIGQLVDRSIHPKAERGEIIVKAYVDGSDLSKMQEAIVNDLSKEYSGSLKFSIVDVIKDPSQAGEIAHFPTVEIGVYFYDAEGKVISSQRGWRGRMPKHEIIQSLEMYSKPGQKSLGEIPLKRIAP